MLTTRDTRDAGRAAYNKIIVQHVTLTKTDSIPPSRAHKQIITSPNNPNLNKTIQHQNAHRIKDQIDPKTYLKNS